MSRPVTLVGARCAGKTTAGRGLAGALGVEFADLDELLVRLALDDLPALSARGAGDLLVDLGEAAYRDLEARALRLALNRVPPLGVLATGGGAVLDSGSRRLLGQASTCIWLRCSPRLLAERMLADPQARPSLTGAPAHEEIEAVLAQREALYAAVAQQVLDVDRLSEHEVVVGLAKLLQGP